ncbi:hypothetical protein [Segnochrobactrum spirostomi]|uniref:Secreted protein n=1 Tax=Segnochrobactrum spirostomi TaxID=2608987 RepID=A0A6A7YC03_9HYPH|nr:hypothetical protein [Segnochrobactrum spirostomi]MQT15192.1 hypothetical protein [Segnochrobactrum spirostomi]
MSAIQVIAATAVLLAGFQGTATTAEESELPRVPTLIASAADIPSISQLKADFVGCMVAMPSTSVRRFVCLDPQGSVTINDRSGHYELANSRQGTAIFNVYLRCVGAAAALSDIAQRVDDQSIKDSADSTFKSYAMDTIVHQDAFAKAFVDQAMDSDRIAEAVASIAVGPIKDEYISDYRRNPESNQLFEDLKQCATLSDIGLNMIDFSK